MTESLRGVFYIIRGSYRKDKAPRFFNDVSESYNWLGGYDPEDNTNEEWYMLMDNVLFMCQAASSDIEKVLAVAERCITKYKTKERYIEVMKSLDIYHYQSPIHLRLEKELYAHYGDYYRPELEEVEERAYTTVRQGSPVLKARSRFKPRKVVIETETPATPVETTPPASPTKTKLAPVTPPARKNGTRLIKKRNIPTTT